MKKETLAGILADMRETLEAADWASQYANDGSGSAEASECATILAEYVARLEALLGDEPE